MKELYEAIFARFQGSTLQAALTGGLHTPNAPQGAKVPYGAYSTPGGHTRPDSFITTTDSVLIRLQFYTTSHAQAHALCGLCMDLFDGWKPEIAGCSTSGEREIPPYITETKGTYTGMLDYRFELTK